jgi:hypothetical protein
VPRTIVVSDIHGCLQELDALLSSCAFLRGTDRLVLIGDLMDRGPDPVGVVRRARELGAETVRGNHDDKHLRWRDHEARKATRPAYRNPMRPLSEAAQNANAALTDEDLAYLRATPYSLALDGNWIAVHAGLATNRPLSEQKPDVLMRVRYVNEEGHLANAGTDWKAPPDAHLWATRWPGPQSVVYGHIVHDLARPRVDEPRPGVWCYGIDTGCCFGGRLTALLLPEREIVQVAARAAYAPYTAGDD